MTAPASLAPVKEEIERKLALVREQMRRRELAGVLLSTQRNFAWLTDGGLHCVARGEPCGLAQLLVTDRSAFLLADGIEMPRLLTEEVGAYPWEPVEWPWYKTGAGNALRMVRGAVASDVPGDGRADAESWMAPLRYRLSPRERDRARWVGARVAEATGDACRAVRADGTEWDVEADVHRRLLAQGVFPYVVLIAGASRMRAFRHPLPTEAPIGAGALIIVTAARWGLHLSCSRVAWFEEPSADWRARFAACRRVDAAFIGETRPGRTIGQVFRLGMDAYAREGFENEWERHHQGGMTGYAGREVFGRPGDPTPVEISQLYAWNPTIDGTKSEDTFLVTDEGPEILTVDPAWPMVEDDRGLARPDFVRVSAAP
ncbi:MAG: M24 family metallopeptidase [Myxococcales bacterium]|nr:M24 family metallopeptidase [Myxococcales bacterium]